MSAQINQWLREIEVLKEELGERERSLPAHSIRPHQLLTIEKLEQRIQALRKKIELARKGRREEL